MLRQRINKKLVSSTHCPIDKKVLIIGDIETPALQLHIYSNFTKTFRFVKQIRRKRYNESLGSAIGVNINQIREHVRRLEQKYNKNPITINTNLSIGEACDLYLAPYYRRFTRAPKRSLGIIENHLKKNLGHFSVVHLTPCNVQKMTYNLIDEGYAPESIRKIILVGNKLYRELIRVGLAIDNPFVDVQRPKVLNIRKNILTNKQRLPFIECCLQIDSVFSDAIQLLLLTGLRVSECIQLRIQDISADFTTLTLVTTKAGIEQKIVLNSLAQKILKRRLSLTWNEYVFPSPIHHHKHISTPRGCFRQIKKLMLLKGHDINALVLHDLRRSFATVCAEVTQGDLQMVAQQLRHSSTNILKRYIHYQQDGLTSASEATAQAIIKPN